MVTGSAQGIGLAIAERLANDGFTVVMTDILRDKLDQEVLRLHQAGKSAEGCIMDVSDESQVKRVFSHINETYGRLDVLVNNAGISPKVNGRRRNFIDTPLEEWSSVLQVNLTGAFLCNREALPLMMKHKWGRIIHISSQAGRTFSRIAGTHYAASKTGLIGLSRNIAAEYGQYGITSNCIAPGRIVSPMASGVSEEKNEEFLKSAAVRRMGLPEEVAATASFLCLDEAGYITGATLDVNGGTFMD